MSLSEPLDLGRRERRKLEIRNRILEAAIALFDAGGFEETRVAEICERADVAHKTFFNHFPSKQHLLREVAGVAVDELLRDIEDARKQPLGTGERLRFFFGRIADNADAAGPMRPELVHEIIRVCHGTDLEPEQARKLHDAFGALVRDGLEAGDVCAEHDPDTLTEVLMGTFYALMFNWSNFEDYPLRRNALAAARFLGQSMSATPAEDR
jgi:AcrR family transcriptional regulator